MSADICNWLRAHIYNAGLNDYVHAEEFFRRVLDNKELDHSSDVYLTTLSSYCTFCLKVGQNDRALSHATQGARLAHEAGDLRFEAEFYGIAGSAMENGRPGAGIGYLDRAIGIISGQSDIQLLPKASFYLSEKTRILMEQNHYAEADAIRDCCGMTVGDFIDDHRIKHAALLLATVAEPVGNIANMSGFSSRSHFNTLFREKFKMTPTEYRKVAIEKAKE